MFFLTDFKRIIKIINKKRVDIFIKMTTRYGSNTEMFPYFPPNISPSTYKRTISCLALVRIVIDFLKCPGNLPAPL